MTQLTDRKVFDHAIFAINTLLYPDASSFEDLRRLEENADEVISRLAEMREQTDETAAGGAATTEEDSDETASDSETPMWHDYEPEDETPEWKDHQGTGF